MLRTVIAIGTLALLGTWAPDAAAQVLWDVIQVGPQRYIRTEQPGHSFPYGIVEWVSISARDGVCAFSANYEGQFVFLTHFDRWAHRMHDSVNVDPDKGLEGSPKQAVTDGMHTCVVWWSMTDAFLARALETQGRPLAPTFPVNNPPPFRWFDTVALPPERIVVVLKQTSGNFQHGDLYLRLFTRLGQALTDPIPLANTPEQSEEGSVVAPLPDGSLIVGFVRGVRPSAVWSVYLLKVNPDLTFGEPVHVAEEWADRIYVKALADGTLFVWYRSRQGGTVRRFSADLTPLSEPLRVDPVLSYAAAAADGRFVVADRIWTGQNPPDDMWVRLFDTNWQPLGPKFKIAIPGGPPITTVLGVNHPVAYDDDGTVWVAWQGYGYGWDREKYLTQLKPFEPGDLNYDRVVNNFDIDPFVLALTNPEEYKKRFPGVPYDIIGDCNFDGQFNNFDIDPFVKLLTKP